MQKAKERLRSIEMEELKTLKDIERMGDLVDTNILRKEAIKWCKNMETQIYNDKLYVFESLEEKRTGLIATQEFIKMFFDITEEEVK